MNLWQEAPCLQEALAAWDFGGEVQEAPRYGKGRINDTYAVSAHQPHGGTRRFILQRINTHVFKDPLALMQNIEGVTGYLRRIILQQGGDADRETMTLLPSRNGLTHHFTGDGGVWRVYLFVEGTVCLQTAHTPELFAASARAFGHFACLLADYPIHELNETIADFHDTRVRYQTFEQAVVADAVGRVGQCAKEIAFVRQRKSDCAVLMDMYERGELPLRVTHNDTKLNNVLLDPQKNEAVCIVDLDTVMPGLLLHDYGDAIRFGANTASEGEQDLASVKFSISLYETYTKAYAQTAPLTKREKEMLPWGARLMVLECGMRFLTDYLDGDVYFRAKTPSQNLDRCRTQFKLLLDMEQRWDEMQMVAGRGTK